MRQRDIDDGVEDYEKEEEEREQQLALEKEKKANEIVDAFFVGEETSESVDFMAREARIGETLKELPAGLKNEVFRQWFARDPAYCLHVIDKFGTLPPCFQKDIAEFIANHEDAWPGGFFGYRNILAVFDAITDRTLHKLIVDRAVEQGRLYFFDLAKNKDKFPYISEKQMLEKARHGAGTYHEYYGWTEVIPYIDRFPSVDRNEAIEGVFKQRVNDRPGVLIEHREKLGLSNRELVDRFYEHKKTNLLCGNIGSIEPEYHQEIAEKAIEQGQSPSVFANASHFQQVDVAMIFDKLKAVESRWPGVGGVRTALLVGISGLPASWCQQIPQEWINELSWSNPEAIAWNMDKFGDKIDRDKVIERLLMVKNFTALIDCADKLGIELNEFWAMRIIEHDGASEVIKTIDKFKKLSRTVYERLVAESPEEAYPEVLKFEGVSEGDIYTAIENIPSGHYFVSAIISSPEVQEMGLDDGLLNALFEGKHGKILVDLRGCPVLKPFFARMSERVGEENFKKYEAQILDLLSQNEPLILDEKDFAAIVGDGVASLPFSDLNTMAGMKGLDEFSLADEDDAQEVYSALKEKGRDWQDPEINRRFESGAAVFGCKRMFEFAKPGHRHDALFGFDRVLELQRVSGLDANGFFHNILQQVAMDTGAYGEGNDASYQVLNSVAQGFRADIGSALEEARAIEGIAQLDKLLADLRQPRDVFKSWRMLMQYKEITVLLEQRELLEELRWEKNRKLRDYVSTLLFHPNVTDTRAVRLFWKDPYNFFELESSHTPQETHDLKKPTNYVHIPHLDLTPDELRDALVEGDLDRIQVWRPLEAVYEVASNPQAWEEYQEFSRKPLAAIIQETLGAGSKGVKNQKKLFGRVRTIIEAQLDAEEFPETREKATEIVQGLANGEEAGGIALSEAAQREIRDAVYFGEFGYSKKIKTVKYRVKINLKSDPDGVVSGNDTQCCMPFGDGKSTLYAFNPVCALMMVQREIGREGYKTVAQSVLTEDKDVKTPIADIVSRFREVESGGVDMADLLPQDILHEERSYVACDSVEVANNYKSGEYSRLLADLYRDFLREYIARFGEDQRLVPEKSVLGRCGYSLQGTGREKNTYLPESPVAYSDKYGEFVEVLSLEESAESFFVRKSIQTAEVERIAEAPIKNPRIKYLTFQDSLETAYIEGKTYKGTTLRQGVAEMENALIAKDINNAAKGRANMSLKHISDDGQMQAYLVAFGGIYGYRFGEEEPVKEATESESCIYVMDIAKLPGAEKGVGMELISEFVRLYQENYIKKGKLIPIRAEAREVSSYKLIVRHLDELGKSIGIRFELEEGESYSRGQDKIHPVAIRPVRLDSL